MRLSYKLSTLFRIPAAAEAEAEGDWVNLVKVLSATQDSEEMDRLAAALGRVANKEAVPPLMKLVLDGFEKAKRIESQVREASLDPMAALAERLRTQTGVFTVGYRPDQVESPISRLKLEAERHFHRKNAALDAIVRIGSEDALQAVIDDPSTFDELRRSLKSNMEFFISQRAVRHGSV